MRCVKLNKLLSAFQGLPKVGSWTTCSIRTNIQPFFPMDDIPMDAK